VQELVEVTRHARGGQGFYTFLKNIPEEPVSCQRGISAARRA